MKIEEFNFSSLSSEAKQWLASAIAGMICADGQVDEKELKFLREVIQFLDTAEEINSMINLVKKREKPVLRSSGRERIFGIRTALHRRHSQTSQGALRLYRSNG